MRRNIFQLRREGGGSGGGRGAGGVQKQKEFKEVQEGVEDGRSQWETWSWRSQMLFQR